MTAPTSRVDLVALIDERMNQIARDASRSAVTQPRSGQLDPVLELLAAIERAVVDAPRYAERALRVGKLDGVYRGDAILARARHARGDSGPDEQPHPQQVGVVGGPDRRVGVGDRDPAELSAIRSLADRLARALDSFVRDFDGHSGDSQNGHDLAPSRDCEGSVGVSPAQGSASSAGDRARDGLS